MTLPVLSPPKSLKSGVVALSPARDPNFSEERGKVYPVDSDTSDTTPNINELAGGSVTKPGGTVTNPVSVPQDDPDGAKKRVDAENNLDHGRKRQHSSGQARPAQQGAASTGALSVQKCGRMADWHVVATEWQAEDLAAAEVRSKGFQVFRPKVRLRQPGTRLRPGRVVLQDAFPGYLLVRWADGELWGAVKAAKGVASILHAVGNREDAACIPAEFMEWLFDQCGDSGILRDEAGPDRLPPIPANTWIRIARGPMAGSIALCEWSSEERVALLFEIMGGQRRTQIRRDHVKELEAKP